MVAKKKSVKKQEKLRLSQVDLHISSFTGPVLRTETGAIFRGEKAEPVMCQVCGKERAMWMHNLKKRIDRQVLLCFGCGEH